MASEDDSELEVEDARKMVSIQNRKNKKSGGFQTMGLSHSVFKGIMKKGYKIPTPIQRKTIPEILSGQDVVAMARTGSGKTAAFLIPMFEKLKHHLTSGPRALILSPTRELAIQTLKFTAELGKFTGLTAAVLLGGDKLEDQFAAIHNKPDVIIATPGRLLHIIMEMNLSLKTIEYVVCDEGDRLFELGFAEQLQETLNRLPSNRQTVIFSATLPNVLVDFARAGLSNPKLIRLDVEKKLSEQLKLVYFTCSSDDKMPVLLFLLSKIIPENSQTVVFLPTKHHVEITQQILEDFGIKCSYIYSDLDQEARKLHTQRFRNKTTNVLLVTDVAARGIDIPNLDYVINYNFPAKSKLFIHRVGRVARAGRIGTAYSLLSPDELSYLLDLHLFLGRDLSLARKGSQSEEQALIGRVPQNLADEYRTVLNKIITSNQDVNSLVKVCDNAMKNYMRTRPSASSESVRRIKDMVDSFEQLPIHPILKEAIGITDEREDVLTKLRTMKCHSTIFEAKGRNAEPAGYSIMKAKRDRHEFIIEKREANKKKKREMTLQEVTKNKEFFIPYQRGDEATERGLDIGISDTFAIEAKGAALDFMTDTAGMGTNRPVGSRKIWDRRKRKYIDESGENKVKRIKTESGVWLPASYKTDKYDKWLKANKGLADSDNDQMAGDGELSHKKMKIMGHKPRNFHTKMRVDSDNKQVLKKFQVKKPEQILKEMKRKEKIKNFQKQREIVNRNRRGGKRKGK